MNITRRKFDISDLHAEVRFQFSALTEDLALRTSPTLRNSCSNLSRVSAVPTGRLTCSPKAPRKRDLGRARINTDSQWTSCVECRARTATGLSGTGPQRYTTIGRSWPSWRRSMACSARFRGTNPMSNILTGNKSETCGEMERGPKPPFLYLQSRYRWRGVHDLPRNREVNSTGRFDELLATGIVADK